MYGQIELTALAGAIVKPAPKTGKLWLCIPIENSGIEPMVNRHSGEHYKTKDGVPRYILPVTTWENRGEEQISKFGNHSVRLDWGKERNAAEKAKVAAGGQREYPPTIGRLSEPQGYATASGGSGYASAETPAADPAGGSDDMPF